MLPPRSSSSIIIKVSGNYMWLKISRIRTEVTRFFARTNLNSEQTWVPFLKARNVNRSSKKEHKKIHPIFNSSWCELCNPKFGRNHTYIKSETNVRSSCTETLINTAYADRGNSQIHHAYAKNWAYAPP